MPTSNTASATRIDTAWLHSEPIIAAFAVDWRRGDRPVLRDFLPADPSQRQHVLIELVHVDLQLRLEAGEPARVEDYLREFPELESNADVVVSLALREFELRREGLTPEELLERFPRYAEQLRPRLVEAPPPSGAMRYRPLHVHAVGGLGEVLMAEDMELGRQVALKQIKQQYADDPASRRRFLTEAEVTARLEHPGIVPVYGLGVDVDGRPYYAMRFIKGQSLEQAIATFHEMGPASLAERNLALRQLLRRFIDVCNAIAYAHSRGILHRDLKPANIMLGPYGETLVVDWGLAKSLGKREPEMAALSNEKTLVLRDTITLQVALEALKALADESRQSSSTAIGSSGTHAGVLLGTPAFMSPEQAAGGGDQVGPASDVYSLGSILYSLLTGRAPFQGQLQDVLHEVQAGEFPAPRAFAPKVPRALEAICLKAMALKPQERFHTCREIAEDIERWLADEPVTCFAESGLAPARRWMRRHQAAVNSVALALACLVAGLGLVVLAGAVGLSALAEQNARLRSSLEELEQTNRRLSPARDSEGPEQSDPLRR